MKNGGEQNGRELNFITMSPTITYRCSICVWVVFCIRFVNFFKTDKHGDFKKFKQNSKNSSDFPRFIYNANHPKKFFIMFKAYLRDVAMEFGVVMLFLLSLVYLICLHFFFRSLVNVVSTNSSPHTTKLFLQQSLTTLPFCSPIFHCILTLLFLIFLFPDFSCLQSLSPDFPCLHWDFN